MNSLYNLIWEHQPQISHSFRTRPIKDPLFAIVTPGRNVLNIFVEDHGKVFQCRLYADGELTITRNDIQWGGCFPTFIKSVLFKHLNLGI